jgi:hypothetical protein
MQNADDIVRLIEADAWRMAVLRAAMELGLPDCWIGAGFVRNAVWDAAHGHAERTPLNDVDAIYFDRSDVSPTTDQAHAARLRGGMPAVPWSVLNMARMHGPTGDQPYASAIDGIRFWPETVTTIAVRIDAAGKLDLAAPLGIDDLLALRVRPTPVTRERRPAVYRQRIAKKNWLARWPKLQIEVI